MGGKKKNLQGTDTGLHLCKFFSLSIFLFPVHFLQRNVELLLKVTKPNGNLVKSPFFANTIMPHVSIPFFKRVLKIETTKAGLIAHTRIDKLEVLTQVQLFSHQHIIRYAQC